MRRIGILCVLSMLITAAAWAAKPIDHGDIDLATGRNDENMMSAPVWDGSEGPSLHIGAFTCACAAGDALVVRNKNRKARYEVGASLRLGELLAEAMRQEARTLGLRVTESAENAEVTVSGTIEDIVLGERTFAFGTLMYYSHVDVSLTLEGGPAPALSRPLSIANIAWRYNAGFGAKDEAREAVAQILYEASQEILGFIAQTLDVPAAASIQPAVDAVAASGVEGRIPDVRRIGLSGTDGAAEKLVARLTRENDVDMRIELYEALGNLRDPVAVTALTGRYAGEDEDGRYFIIKALGSIGTDEALAFVGEEGITDADRAARNLARHIANR